MTKARGGVAALLLLIVGLAQSEGFQRLPFEQPNPAIQRSIRTLCVYMLTDPADLTREEMRACGALGVLVT